MPSPNPTIRVGSFVEWAPKGGGDPIVGTVIRLDGRHAELARQDGLPTSWVWLSHLTPIPTLEEIEAEKRRLMPWREDA